MSKAKLNLSFTRALCNKGLKILLITLVLLGLGGESPAQQDLLKDPQTAAARRQTILALQAAKKNKWDLARQHIAAAKDPLASKIYVWLTFTREKDQGSYSRLTQFIRHHPHWPGLGKLQARAEHDMPAALAPEAVVAWFEDYPPKTARGVDLYVKSLLATGHREQAQNFLDAWWSRATLARDDQRELYAKYGQYISHKAHRQRFDRLLFDGQHNNARAIARVIGPGFPELAEARIALAEGHAGVNALIAKVPQKLQSDPGLMFERLRWRRKNNLDVEAMEILHNTPAADQAANAKEWWSERHIIIRRLLEKKSYRSAYLLAAKHFQKEGIAFAQAEWMAGWLALRFLNKPTDAYQHFEVLYQGVGTPISQSRAAYWAGRAAAAMKQPDLAKTWYARAALHQTTFYGQLGAAALNRNYGLPHAAPPVINDGDLARFNGSELVQVAKLFYAADLKKEGGDFIHAFIQKESTAKAYRFGAEFFAEKKDYYNAVRTAKKATEKGMFLTAQAYPVITERLQNVAVEWALVHGLIRQESMFDEQARSSAGALGLMQLMPGTAKETAGKIKATYSLQALTGDPSYNIRLGSAYLSSLLVRFDGSYPMAIAAYNAGPSRVWEWVKIYGDPRKDDVDLVDWIELIPIYETRNYVQRVLESTYIYRLRLKDKQKPPAARLHVPMPDLKN